MLIVHLFVSYAHSVCHFSLPPGVGGWLRLLLVALPGLFCLSLCFMSIPWTPELTSENGAHVCRLK